MNHSEQIPTAASLAEVRARIAAAARAAGRDPAEVTLVTGGKTHPVTWVEAALAAGHRVLGKNRVQEAEASLLWADYGTDADDADGGVAVVGLTISF